MSTRRLSVIEGVPDLVKVLFRIAPELQTPEEHLWRERAARMTLDALGYTNLTMKPTRHNEAVRYARRWFRGFFLLHPDILQTDDPVATFDGGCIEGFENIRDAVLDVVPFIFPDRDED